MSGELKLFDSIGFTFESKPTFVLGEFLGDSSTCCRSFLIGFSFWIGGIVEGTLEKMEDSLLISSLN